MILKNRCSYLNTSNIDLIWNVDPRKEIDSIWYTIRLDIYSELEKWLTRVLLVATLKFLKWDSMIKFTWWHNGHSRLHMSHEFVLHNLRNILYKVST